MGELRKKKAKERWEWSYIVVVDVNSWAHLGLWNSWLRGVWGFPEQTKWQTKPLDEEPQEIGGKTWKDWTGFCCCVQYPVTHFYGPTAYPNSPVKNNNKITFNPSTNLSNKSSFSDFSYKKCLIIWFYFFIIFSGKIKF